MPRQRSGAVDLTAAPPVSWYHTVDDDANR
jgi:hypothetical protein